MALAFALDDENLLERASGWIDDLLNSQRPDGGFGPTENSDEWPRAVALKALIQWADGSGDERVAPFIRRYLRWYSSKLAVDGPSLWGEARGFESLLALAWLNERQPEPELVDLASLIAQTCTDWSSYFVEFPFRGLTSDPFEQLAHSVNVAMALKAPALASLFDNDPRHRAAVHSAFQKLDEFHGQVHGLFSGDEFLAGTDPSRGVELCAIVEAMYSLEQLIRIWGEPSFGDRLEQVAYNALPTSMSSDVTSHQYHQQANQIAADIAYRPWTAGGDDSTIFGLEPTFGCCTANLHQGWPKLLRSFWLEASDDELVAVVHGPSTVNWTTTSGRVQISTHTDYPFGDILTYDIVESTSSPFTLGWRVPEWCVEAALEVNGDPVDVIPDDGYLKVRREWGAGDRVTLNLPSRPRLIDRPHGGAGVSLGPLVLVHAPGEIWERIPESQGFGDWEVRARRSWAAALAVDVQTLAACNVVRAAVPDRPFSFELGSPTFGLNAAVIVEVPSVVWFDWPVVNNSAAHPSSAVSKINPLARAFPLPLIPYGCTRIRIAEFPLIGPRQSVPT